jgi:hypothetical protein
MHRLDHLALWLRCTLDQALRRRLNGPHAEDDRGDVPGWVMVTVMSAILVVAILGVFEPEVKSAITNALDSVTNSK